MISFSPHSQATSTRQPSSPNDNDEAEKSGVNAPPARQPGDASVPERGEPAVINPRMSPEETNPRVATAVAHHLRLSIDRPAHGVVVIRMHGEVDLSTVTRVNELISQRLTAAVLHSLILDLTEVTFFSSSGLDLLLQTQRRASYRGIALHIVAGHSSARRILELTELTGQLPLRATVREAVSAATGHL